MPLLQTELILYNIVPRQVSQGSFPILLSLVHVKLKSASDTGYNEWDIKNERMCIPVSLSPLTLYKIELAVPFKTLTGCVHSYNVIFDRCD